MTGDFRRIEVVKRTIRYEFPAPVEAKTLGIACAWIHQEFDKCHGRQPTNDNDYWLEPTDGGGIAFVFEVSTEQERGIGP